MTWGPLHGSFWHDDKVRHLAELMEVRPAEAAGWVAQLWAAAVIKAPHGDLSKVRVAELARWAWANEGEQRVDPETLVRAMVEARLLDEPEPGTLLIHDWELPRYMREANRKREERERDRAQRLETLQTSRPGRVQRKGGDQTDRQTDRQTEKTSDQSYASRSTGALSAQPSLPSVCVELAPSGDSTPEEPPLVTFPAQGVVKQWHLTAKVVAVLSAAYPRVDVVAEARKALAWVLASPERAKTARGYRRFLTSWVAGSVNRGSAVMQQQTSKPSVKPTSVDLPRDAVPMPAALREHLPAHLRALQRPSVASEAPSVAPGAPGEVVPRHEAG